MSQDTERISNRSLLGAFFLVVLLCAVFFSLGYFLGYKQRGPAAAAVTEQVAAPADADSPPTTATPAAPSTAGSASVEPSSGPGAAVAAPAPTAAGAAAVSAPPAPASAGASEARAPAANSPAAAVPAKGATGAAAESARPAVPPGLLVQAAALTNQQDADNMVQALTSRGYPALMLTPQQVHAKDAFFRVVVGPYKTRAAAESARNKLAAEGFKPFLRQ